ncbi:hypothetical protein EVV80_28785, partial [Klebsiella pneumoniae]
TSEDQLARFSDIPGLESLCYQQPLAAGDDAAAGAVKPRRTSWPASAIFRGWKASATSSRWPPGMTRPLA